MSDDIVTRLRDIEGGYGFRAICRQAADEIERLREERETYRTRYLKCLASTVWKPSTHWKTYRNPQREDGLFVATVGDLVRSYQAIPDGALSIQCGLPHDVAEEVVEILNAWTASDAAWKKTANDR
jgi:hypothetical protein